MRIHFHRRRRRHLKVLRNRERRSRSLSPSGGHRFPHSTLDLRFASTWLPNFPSSSSSSAIPRKRSWSSFSPKRLWRAADKNARPLSHEGRSQCLRTTSCRLSEVSDSLRGLGWLVRFFKRHAVPLEVEAAGFRRWRRMVDLQKLTILSDFRAVEPTPLSGFRSHGAQWSLHDAVVVWVQSVSRATARCTLDTFMSSRACPQPLAHTWTEASPDSQFDAHALCLQLPLLASARQSAEMRNYHILRTCTEQAVTAHHSSTNVTERTFDAPLASMFLGSQIQTLHNFGMSRAERERTSFMSLLPHDAPSRPLCSCPPGNLNEHVTSGYLGCDVVSEQQYWDTGIEGILSTT